MSTWPQISAHPPSPPTQTQISINIQKNYVWLWCGYSQTKGRLFWKKYLLSYICKGMSFVNTCDILSLLLRVVTLGTLPHIILGSIHICSIYATWVIEKLLWKIREAICNTCFRVPIAIHMTVTCHTVRAGDNMKNLYSAFIHLMNVREKTDF